MRVGGSVTDPILVRNGLRQGYTLAPALFNLYFSSVAASCCSNSSVPGVEYRFRIGCKLLGDCTAVISWVQAPH